METRKLGNSTLDVSVVGLGANNFGGRIDLAATRRVVHRALDLGITLIDTADSYGGNGASEACLGEILGARRKDVVLATKFGMALDRSGQARRRFAPLHHAGGRGEPEAVRAPTGSTSTSCIVPTRRRRSRKPCGRSTIWCSRERCGSPGARTCRWLR